MDFYYENLDNKKGIIEACGISQFSKETHDDDC